MQSSISSRAFVARLSGHHKFVTATVLPVIFTTTQDQRLLNAGISRCSYHIAEILHLEVDTSFAGLCLISH